MRVLLVRHGVTVDISSASTDYTRWLNQAGRTEVENIGSQIKTTGPAITSMYTSPLVRAVQTAELLAASCGFAGPIESLSALGVDRGSTAEALVPLDHADDDDVIAFVSHMPKVSVLAGHLVGNNSFPPFPTAGAALIDVSNSSLQWMIAPERRS